MAEDPAVVSGRPETLGTAHREGASPSPSLPSGRILVADHDPRTTQQLKELLEARYQVLAVEDGAAALTAGETWQPDLILADVHLDPIDGYALIAALRKNPRTNLIPVLLWSDKDGNDTRLTALAAGADDYLEKPFDPRELLLRVNSHMRLADVRRGTVAERSAHTRQLEQLMSRMPAGVMACDAAGRVTFFNLRATEIWRASPLPNENYASFAQRFQVLSSQGEPLATDERQVPRALRTGQSVEGGDSLMERPDGSRFTAHYNITPTFGSDGKVTGAIVVFQDVSAERVAEQALQQTRERYRAVFEQASVGIFECDLQGRILNSNPALSSIMGFTSAELRTMNWRNLTHPDELAGDEQLVARLLRSEVDSIRVERRYQRKGGTYGWVDVFATLIRDPAGAPVHGLAVVIDVSERKRAEEVMNASRNAERSRRQELEVLTQVAPAGIWMAHDPECRQITGNAAAYAMLRMQRGQNLSRTTGQPTVQILQNGVPLPTEQLAMRVAALTGETVTNQELEFRFPDGTSTWAYGSATPLIGEDGKVRGVICVMLDVTERKAVEAALRASEEQLRLVTDHTSVMFARIDRNHRYRFVNRTYAERYGRPTHEFVGLPLSEVISREMFEEAKPQLARALAGETVQFEVLYPKIQRWGHIVYQPERDSDGTIVGLVAVVVDITERKQVEIKLQRARDEALAASRAKDDFLAALSHELRTPLSPVLLLASESAQDENLSAEVRADFELIRKNIELEARLIDDLLDLTRISRDKLGLETRPLDLAGVLQDALATVGPDFAAKQIALTVEVSPEPIEVRGDAVRLQQVFWNVLKNAVKFTPAGGKVSVRCHLQNERRSAGVEISDTGIGITAGELTRVFEAFSQGDHAAAGGSHRFGGLGLGLAISRRVVELHLGKITAHSAGRDQGATFCIELPLSDQAVLDGSNSRRGPQVPVPLPPRARTATRAGPAESKTPVSPPAPTETRRILLAEDHVPTRAALEHLLVRRGYKVRAAASAAEAREFAAQESFDILISDIGLPDGSGYELMKDLKARYGLLGISLTGYGMAEDVARSRDAGFVEHLTKPVRIQSLAAALARIARGPNPR